MPVARRAVIVTGSELDTPGPVIRFANDATAALSLPAWPGRFPQRPGHRLGCIELVNNGCSWREAAVTVAEADDGFVPKQVAPTTAPVI